MENFSLKIVDHIAIIKVELISATLRDSQALWDLMDINSIFEKQKIIIDLSTCTSIDSTFIGMIVKIFRRVDENNSTLKLVFPQINELDSFRVIGITKILDCFDTVQNAVESYNPDSSVSKIDFDKKDLLH
ncbi:MAG: STAS domain-containing protein [Ignavibacteria bacterium]|nr:STAS domain-containing protein [Ignavibacteria bacterium]